MPTATDDLFPFDDDQRGVFALRTHLTTFSTHPALGLSQGVLPWV
jgi:hypothetical protein